MRMPPFRRSALLTFALCLLTFALPLPLPAAGTAVWEMSTYKEFLRGSFTSVSLSREGRLLLAPKIEALFSSDQPLVWSLARAADGALYLGTGHRGRVYRVKPDGSSSLLWTAAEPEVFALAAGPDGQLYAGASPDGKVYRIGPDGRAAEFFHPQTKYIWSLAFGRDGALYVGTGFVGAGGGGKVFRVDRSGKGEVYFDTRQGHVTSLVVEPSGALLAGTDPNGLLYRITAKDKAFVLYDSFLPEIRAIEIAADGGIYIAAMGGAVGRMAQPAAGPGTDVVVSPVVQSITVSASEQQGGPQLPRPQPETPRPPQTPPAAAPPAVVSVAGGQKSALLRIAADNTVETLWTSAEENVYSLLAQPAGLLFSTDNHGRIYRLDAGRQATLVAETGEEETTRLASVPGAVVAATGNLGKLYRLSDLPAANGSYEAPVRDTGGVSRWGKLSWKARAPAGSAIEFLTRSGNSAVPDATWSEWSPPLRQPDGEPIRSPNARYIQWRALFRGAPAGVPELESVSLAYLPQNTAPVIRSITVMNAQPAKPAAPGGAPAPSAADFSITVTETGAVSTSTNPGTTTVALSRAGGQPSATAISWQAEDADGDKLLARVSFRGEGENQWKLLKENWSEASLAIDADALADGVYLVQVVVSDSPSNPPATARETELIGAPFLIDNTPPAVRPAGAERSGGRAVVKFEASDAASMLRRAEYSLNAGPWIPVYSDDGIVDSKSESFTIALEQLKPGEHLITLRVADSAGNPGLGKAVVR